MRVRLRVKSKPNNYMELCVINEADGWRGRNVWYPGRSVRYAPKGVTTVQSSAERTEVSRGHSSRKGRTESVGVLSMTGKGGMTDHDRKHKQWPVSYTHLDVYKRQMLFTLETQWKQKFSK